MITVEGMVESGKCPCGVCSSHDGKHEKHICRSCNQRIVRFKDKKSEREFEISSLCQKCQDQTFNKKKVLFTKKLATILLVQTKLLPPSTLGVRDLKNKI